MTATIRMKADMLGIVEGTSDRWYLTNGTTAVGPVNLDLIARGIESGRVPLESFVRHEGWKVWRPLADFALVVEPEIDAPPSEDTPLPRFLLPTGADVDETMWPIEDAVSSVAGPPPLANELTIRVDERLEEDFDEIDFKRITDVVGLPRVTVPSLTPRAAVPSLASGAVPSLAFGEVSLVDDIAAPARPSTPAERHPADAFAGAGDFESALGLALRAAVASSHSDVGLIHRVDADSAIVIADFHAASLHDGAAVPTDSRRPRVGTRTPVLDAAVVAANAGHRVIAEPTPGPAGRATVARLEKMNAAHPTLPLEAGVSPEAGGSFEARSDTPVEHALMFAIRQSNPERLLGMLELGRRRPYRGAEIAAVEDLVEALGVEIRDRGWAVRRA